MVGALGVGSDRRCRIGPRTGHIGLTGEVEDHVGTHVGQEVDQAVRIQEVGATRRPIGTDDRVSLCQQVGYQMATDESGSPGDEGLHRCRICWSEKVGTTGAAYVVAANHRWPGGAPSADQPQVPWH